MKKFLLLAVFTISSFFIYTFNVNASSWVSVNSQHDLDPYPVIKYHYGNFGNSDSYTFYGNYSTTSNSLGASESYPVYVYSITQYLQISDFNIPGKNVRMKFHVQTNANSFKTSDLTCSILNGDGECVVSKDTDSYVIDFEGVVTTPNIAFSINVVNSPSLDRVYYLGEDTSYYGTNFSTVTAYYVKYSIMYDNSDAVQNEKLDNINNTQNQTNQKLDKTNEELGELNDSITDETSPNTSSLENSAGWLPPGPVDSILNLPLAFFNNLTVNLSKSCNPVIVPLPYVDKNIELPCISTIYEQIGVQDLLNWIGVIVSGLILFSYFKHLYQWVDNTLSMRENTWNDTDQWGGL